MYPRVRAVPLIILSLVLPTCRHQAQLDSVALSPKSHREVLCDVKPRRIEIPKSLACTSLGYFLRKNNGVLPLDVADLKQALTAPEYTISDVAMAYSQAPLDTAPDAPRVIVAPIGENGALANNLYFGVTLDRNRCIRSFEFIAKDFRSAKNVFGELENLESGDPMISTARQSFCFTCHRNRSLIFQTQFWDNSFFNPATLTALVLHLNRDNKGAAAEEFRRLVSSRQSCPNLLTDLAADRLPHSREIKKLAGFTHHGINTLNDVEQPNDRETDVRVLFRQLHTLQETTELCQLMRITPGLSMKRYATEYGILYFLRLVKGSPPGLPEEATKLLNTIPSDEFVQSKIAVLSAFTDGGVLLPYHPLFDQENVRESRVLPTSDPCNANTVQRILDDLQIFSGTRARNLKYRVSSPTAFVNRVHGTQEWSKHIGGWLRSADILRNAMDLRSADQAPLRELIERISPSGKISLEGVRRILADERFQRLYARNECLPTRDAIFYALADMAGIQDKTAYLNAFAEPQCFDLSTDGHEFDFTEETPEHPCGFCHKSGQQAPFFEDWVRDANAPFDIMSIVSWDAAYQRHDPRTKWAAPIYEMLNTSQMPPAHAEMERHFPKEPWTEIEKYLQTKL